MTLKYENQKLRQGYSYIIGCDEVGRGCLAGPVVAAAVVFVSKTRPKWFSEINDSKKLLPEKREYLSKLIKSHAVWSIGEVSSEVVDEINIHNASLLAMKKAVEKLILSFPGVILRPNASEAEESQTRKEILRSAQDDAPERGFLAVDGKFKVPNLEIHQEPIIEGDGKVLSIAAASIIAKVYRDSLMRKFDKQYSGYEFARHKGYATEYHRAKIFEKGLSPIHRLSFCTNLTV
jgi:ribonuclease HII